MARRLSSRLIESVLPKRSRQQKRRSEATLLQKRWSQMVGKKLGELSWVEERGARGLVIGASSAVVAKELKALEPHLLRTVFGPDQEGTWLKVEVGHPNVAEAEQDMAPRHGQSGRRLHDDKEGASAACEGIEDRGLREAVEGFLLRSTKNEKGD